MKELIIETNNRNEIIDITNDINKLIDIEDGICVIYVMHATAGLIINEYEPNIEKDYLSFFKHITSNQDFKHNKIDNNAEAHLLSALLGPSKQIIIKNSALLLSTWQKVLLCEFDGPRKRKIFIKCQK